MGDRRVLLDAYSVSPADTNRIMERNYVTSLRVSSVHAASTTCFFAAGLPKGEAFIRPQRFRTLRTW